MRWIPATLAVALLTPASLASAAVVKVSAASSTSTLPDADGVSYDPKNLIDGKQATVWVEGDTGGSGLGTSVSLDLGGEKTVTGLRIWNGNWYTFDFWQRHNRAKEIEVIFPDDSKETFTLDDEMKPQVVTLAKAMKTSELRVRIKSIHRGNTFNDTVFSEIQVLDDSPADSVPVKAFSASSVYPSDADGDYDPDNVDDGILDSMWCENVKDGDGTGEWLDFDFGASRKVSQLRLNNGNAYSFAMFMKANHATTATLSFSDGSKEEVSFKSSFMDQTVSFPAHTTTKVRVTFTGVKAGKEFNDLCISEATFLE